MPFIITQPESCAQLAIKSFIRELALCHCDSYKFNAAEQRNHSHIPQPTSAGYRAGQQSLFTFHAYLPLTHSYSQTVGVRQRRPQTMTAT